MRKILATNYMCQKCNKKKPFFFYYYILLIQNYISGLTDQSIVRIQREVNISSSHVFFNVFRVVNFSAMFPLCIWLMSVVDYSFKISHLKMCLLFNNFEHTVSQRVCLPQFEGTLFVLPWISNISLCSSSFHHTKFHILLFLVFVLLLNMKMRPVVLVFHYLC